MAILRIEHAVPSFDEWKQAFDRDPAGRQGAGVRRYLVLRGHQDPNYVMIDLDFATVAEAEAFLRRLETIWAGPGKAVMQNPRARICDVVETREL